MNKMSAAVMALFLLIPCPAGAQGYGGLSTESLPYAGTGTGAQAGHAAATSPAQADETSAAEPAEAGMDGEASHDNADAESTGQNQAGTDAAAEPDDAERGISPPPEASYAASFAPKAKAYETPPPKTLYDFVNGTAPGSKSGAAGQQAQAQANAALKAQSDDIARANSAAERADQDRVSQYAADLQAAAQQKQEDAQNGADSPDAGP